MVRRIRVDMKRKRENPITVSNEEAYFWNNKKTLLLLIAGSVFVLLTRAQFSLLNFYNDLDRIVGLEELIHLPPPSSSLSDIIFGDMNSTSTTTSVATTGTESSNLNKFATSDDSNNKNDEGKKTTKIIGFADYGYKDIGYQWYKELEKLGYTEHMVAVQDTIAAEYYASKGDIRYDLVYQPPNNLTGLKQLCEHEYTKLSNPAKRSQRYRRMLFGSRWNYVLRQLELGYHVLLTDVDNIYTQYKSMAEMENSEYDIFHAYAGTVPSFPLNLFRLMGLTLCGGMSWLRSTPKVIEFAREIVNTCDCVTLDCNCFCDDQVVVNKYVYYNYLWDHRTPGEFPEIPQTLEEMDWQGYTGYDNKTGNKIKIWDRDVAYRAPFDEKTCPNKTRSWIAMPTGLDRDKAWDIWKDKCMDV